MLERHEALRNDTFLLSCSPGSPFGIFFSDCIALIYQTDTVIYRSELFRALFLRDLQKGLCYRLAK